MKQEKGGGAYEKLEAGSKNVSLDSRSAEI